MLAQASLVQRFDKAKCMKISCLMKIDEDPLEDHVSIVLNL